MVSYTSLCMLEEFSTVEMKAQSHKQALLSLSNSLTWPGVQQYGLCRSSESSWKMFQIPCHFLIMKIIQGLMDSMKDCTHGVFFSPNVALIKTKA